MADALLPLVYEYDESTPEAVREFDPLETARSLRAHVRALVAAQRSPDYAPLDEAEDRRERRRLARLILMVRAVALIELTGCSCRDAWKKVRAAYEAGLIYLPANV